MKFVIILALICTAYAFPDRAPLTYRNGIAGGGIGGSNGGFQPGGRQGRVNQPVPPIRHQRPPGGGFNQGGIGGAPNGLDGIFLPPPGNIGGGGYIQRRPGQHRK